MMILEYGEDINSDFVGTVIDIETIGDFDRSFRNDSRQYRNMRQIIFGCITNKHLHIFCARGQDAINELQTITIKVLDGLPKPWYAFNCEFERGVFFHQFSKEVTFDGELQRFKYESKANACKDLNIQNYNDPFDDVGKLCMDAWGRGEFKKAIAHNRACLLKERDILINRGFREPDLTPFLVPPAS